MLQRLKTATVLRIYSELFNAGPSQGIASGVQNAPQPPPVVRCIRRHERWFWTLRLCSGGRAIALNLRGGIKHDAVMSARRGRCCKQAARRPSCGSVNFCRLPRSSAELEDSGGRRRGAAGRGRRRRHLKGWISPHPQTRNPISH